jgi:hypothetical protein
MVDGTGQTPEQRAAELEAAKQVAIQEAIARFNQRQVDRDRATTARIAAINGATTADQLAALNRPVTVVPPSRTEGDLEEPVQDEDLQEESGDASPLISGTNPDGNSDTLFTPEPNLMSGIYQPTYYFKLYVLNDLNPSEDNQVVIAETGLTALNITEVKIDGIVGPNMRTRNSMATNITIRLSEPFGMNLPDRLVSAARQLKIKNYLKTTFMLRLRLQGYAESGRAVEIGEGWCWRIMIIDIKSKVSEQGAEHTISAIPYPEIALQDRNGILPTNITVDGDTVGDILTNMATKMNEYVKEVHGFDFITYEFIDVPYPEGSGSPVARPFEQSVKTSLMNEESERSVGPNEKVRAQFSQGTDIPSIVDTVFSASEGAVSLGTLERSITVPIEGSNIEAKPTSIMHRVETYVDAVKFDPIYGDYQKRITFVIRPYETMRIQSGLKSAADPAMGAQEKIQHAIKRAFLCKQYDYIFTGLNTEVEKFDIELNFRWAVSAPMLYQGGEGATTPNYSNATLPRHVKDVSYPVDPQQRRSAIEELRSQRNNLWGVLQNTDTTVVTEEQKSTARVEYERLTAQERELILATRRDGQQRLDQLQGAEEFEDSEIILAEDLDPEMSVVHPMTVSRSSEDPSIQSGVGMPNYRTGTKSVYGTLLNQLYGSFDGNLQTLSLEIRGDPYWLGPDPTPMGNYRMLEAAEVASRYGPSVVETPNLMNGEHMFAFNFGLPQGFDESTGSVSLNNDETYSGFYAVTQIEHTFSQGKFTQKLEAFRIPGIALSDLNQTTEAAESQDPGDLDLNNEPTPTVPTPSQVPTTSTRFNPPAIDGSLDGFNEDNI